MSECYFCGESKPEVLEDHHIIPGQIVTSERDAERDDVDETVVLCANCHYKMHHLLDYVIQFYSDKMQERELSEGFDKASDLG